MDTVEVPSGRSCRVSTQPVVVVNLQLGCILHSQKTLVPRNKHPKTIQGGGFPEPVPPAITKFAGRALKPSTQTHIMAANRLLIVPQSSNQ